ncbi:hypothetical protein L6654_06560 [Bradyrhizobium sp. WYCCWR 13023]|uniref:Muconolactone isomerase domain-containing protein n=1 Tax=Bradyrhizobium zhengyangense TaxID=2911009 RepID=A0A9X1R4U7_9BRAD|nr:MULTISPECIES: hypothetical protein [Bradyrhizobium]MCG2626284.1 hypothetical protein [Bradyrhizobium zhengyangense]MCG2644704.1 hypothetical protein [Bradyrhizobium zhengyangense]MCG2668292.1 hypothetical protein [Bradyrhizobium zhengyangense]
MIHTGVRLALGALVAGFLFESAPLFAQSSANPGAGSVAAQHHTTRVLAIGKLTEKAKSADLPEVLSREVPATLELYLRGKIADWYATAEQTEVVFLLNVTSVEEARALLEPLPLGQAGMMTFDLTPIGPLLPLGRLLKAKN